jgi:hypothetical protein
MSPKKKSLAGFLILLAAGVLAAMLGKMVPAPWTELAAVFPLVSAGLIFLVTGRIACPNCGAKVEGPGWGMNPAPLLLLWLARESCPKCHKPLDW